MREGIHTTEMIKNGFCSLDLEMARAENEISLL